VNGTVTRGRRGAALVLVAAAFLAQVLVARGASAATTLPRDRMLSLTNQDRSEYHKARLALDSQLSRYARQHSERMADRGSLFHTADLAAKLKGRDWSIGGENVGYGPTLANLERAFMGSTPHRSNILRTAFDHAAVGVFKSGGRIWVTVIFYG
jgi:uncharacterized protein YkwD